VIHAWPLQRGVTLIELLLGIGVLLVVLGVVLVTYRVTTDAGNAYAAGVATSSVGTAIKVLQNGRQDFTGIDNTSFIQTGKAPESMISNGAFLVGPWGGAITIAPATYRGISNGGYQIELAQIPKGICVELTGYLSRQFRTVRIDTTVVQDDATLPPVPQIANADIIAACSGSDYLTLQVVGN
jgi:type II secretory pathway pseudopilin PulG